METSLHRDLKRYYAGENGQTEVALAEFRIDVVRNNVLIEIQHASLASIRRKIGHLLQSYDVHVIKPIVARKRLVKLARRNGTICNSRVSPKRGTLLDLFGELVYFTKVFPHPRLVLEAVLVEVEEVRYPRRKSTRRWQQRDYHVQDQRLVRVQESLRLTAPADLLQLLPLDLAEPFDTHNIARALNIPRWHAQQIAYCCRHCGAFQPIGKKGNARLYKRSA